MTYPAPPGPRIAYDLDGSVGLYRNLRNGSWGRLSENALKALNSERTAISGTSSIGWSAYVDGGVSPGICLVILLPVPIKLAAVGATITAATGFAYDNIGFPIVETSPNATNGDDGDWTRVLNGDRAVLRYTDSFAVGAVDMIGGFPSGTFFPNNDGYRRPYDSANPAGYRAVSGQGTRQVRAIRLTPSFTSTDGSYPTAVSLRLYGSPDTLASGNRLEFWSADLDARMDLSNLDWGDVPLSSTATRAFRVKNVSPSGVANALTIGAVSGASTTTPPPEGMFVFSIDNGVTWNPTVNLTTLGPGSVTPKILVRRVVPMNATLSNWSPRITADAGSWS